MPYLKQIVCLANSRKYKALCVAGKEFTSKTIGPWIRPVSSLTTGQLSVAQTLYSDGSAPVLLDIMEIGLLSHDPEDFQSENHVIDTETHWEKRGTFSRSQLNSLLDKVPKIWLNGFQSNNGLNDRVPEDYAAEKLDSSLLCIRPDELTLYVTKPWDRKTVRAHFGFSGVTYDFKVTDTMIEKEYLKQPDGYQKRGNAVLCISLAPPFKGNCYKLVAGVIRV